MKRSKIVISFLCTLLLLVSGCSSNSQVEDKDENNITLSVATFNIDVKAPETKVSDQKELLEKKGVEIFGIQEVDSGLARYGKDSYDPMSDFQTGTYTDSYFGESIKKGAGSYGNGVVSKYKILEETHVALVGTEDAPKDLQEELIDIYSKYDPNDKATMEGMMRVWGEGGLVAQGAVEPRSYTRVVIEKEGKKIAFYSTHLSVESYDIRKKQMLQLKDVLDNDPIEYKIIVGDFNVDEGTNEFNVFEDEYVLANGYEGKWVETFKEEDEARKSVDKGLRIKFLDNVIVSKNIGVEKVEAIPTDLSDHYPLIVKLVLK